jgi:sugar O-acyltransferase (sialic acid O-acetyltransferase NeuD family)
MKQLLIIGAGNVGGYLSHNIEEYGDYEVIGFLDDDTSKQNKTIYGRTVIGVVDEINNYFDRKHLHVVIGISSPIARKSIAKKIADYGFNFPNFIAKNVWISKNVTLGRGVIIYPGTSINYETHIKDFVIANMNCAIGHNCTIEEFSTLAPGVNLAGFTHVEPCVSIGIGASTKQNIRIGKKAVIGGQSMLVKDVAPNALITGVPGKNLRK